MVAMAISVMLGKGFLGALSCVRCRETPEGEIMKSDVTESFSSLWLNVSIAHHRMHFHPKICWEAHVHRYTLP